jgi:predicted DNA-binding ribbon-helix-helix protein
MRRREGLLMKSPIVKRSVRIDSRKTSVGLENEFWNALKQIADDQRSQSKNLFFKIVNKREHNNLSSAIRLFILDYYCKQAAVRSASR